MVFDCFVKVEHGDHLVVRERYDRIDQLARAAVENLIVAQHDQVEMKILDTGLGIKRTAQVLVFSLTTRPKTKAQKEAFYQQLVIKLHEELDIQPSDVMVNLTVNFDEDWSFWVG